MVPLKEGFTERLTRGPLQALGIGRTKPAGGVRIHGIDNVMVTYARCCQPVPGDPVVGLVTIGRGVSLHRQDCPNTFDSRVAPERRVAVEWDARAGDTFPVRLVVTGKDRASMLADIAKAITAANVNIRTAGLQVEDHVMRGVFVVEVPDLAKLYEVIGAMRKVQGVQRVERRQRIGKPTGGREDADG
jgi:GTP pyrophosphokinase